MPGNSPYTRYLLSHVLQCQSYKALCDAAGHKAAWRALEVSLALAPDHKPIRFLFLPDGEDPDTYVRKHGAEGFEARVREAETLSQFLLPQLRSENDLA